MSRSTRYALCEICRWPMNECSCERDAELARARANDAERTSKRGADGKPAGYRRFAAPDADEGPARIVPCNRCKQPVEISAFAWEMAREKLDALLARKGEEPLRDDELTWCRDCHELVEAEHEQAMAREDKHRQEIWDTSRSAGAVGRFDADWLKRHGYAGDVRDLEELIRRDKAKPARGRRAAKESVD